MNEEKINLIFNHWGLKTQILQTILVFWTQNDLTLKKQYLGRNQVSPLST